METIKGPAAQAVFTPGPWEYVRDIDYWQIATAYDQRGTIVVEGKDNHEGNDADYHLIAAAPELYEALTTTRANIETIRASHPGVSTYDVWLRVVNAAIAKAEGRSAPTAPSAIASDSTSEGDDP